ncbi:hypothetical protein [Acidovorax sp. sic0104]|uniref:hypothetical protein n=1 Tax=Acidovorax sp. sic0104 TaxID=2854784 RepID=UPI001C497C59|nr:hypothetical protein [Acidovorax sp. sic0104]MBV7540627.1 hypothetical protein [Acidovorax sp. sic0104]
MAAPRTLQRLHQLIWALIYGGLLTLTVGIATARTDDALGWSLAAVGGLAAVAGLVLIGVRSRLRADSAP